MTLTREQINRVENSIKESLRKKFLSYRPETSNMPFHYRLLGRDRMVLFSFIQSLNTTFGTSIYEPAAETLASLNFPFVQKQFVVGKAISEQAQIEIMQIMNNITIGKSPNKEDEIDAIRRVCTRGKMVKPDIDKADLCVKNYDGSIYLFDLKTVKPNKGNIKNFKESLLNWAAVYLYDHPDAVLHTYIALPYNPYEPKPYERWTLRGMLDIENEFIVGAEFWDFLGGEGAYSEILDCFERAGIELRPEIDDYFSKFNK